MPQLDGFECVKEIGEKPILSLDLFLGGVGGRYLNRRGRGRDINHFSGAGVVQLLAGFFLDGLGIGLEGFDLGSVAVVFLLQLVDFVAETLVLSPLLQVDHHAVGAEHYVEEEPDGNDGDCQGGQATPGYIPGLPVDWPHADVAAGWNGDRLNMYENTDGRPVFFPQATEASASVW